MEAALILIAQRTFGGQVPSGASYTQFIQRMYARVQRLDALRSAAPASPAALLLGGSQPRPAPSLQAIDLYFRAAWADGILNLSDVLRPLG